MGTFELVVNAIVSGFLLGGFYAVVSMGVAIVFGLLNVANIAHPAFVVAGAYLVFILNSRLGWDPILSGFVLAPVFFAVGVATFWAYDYLFERKKTDSLRGLVFFFGIMLLIEVALLLIYGVDYRLVKASYLGQSIRFAGVDLAYRLLIPFLVAGGLSLLLHLLLSRTFYGRAIMGVSQDAVAMSLMGANPHKIKAIAFGLAIGTASIAGALLIMVLPVEPSAGREFIGTVFAVTVLGGMGSLGGAFGAGILLGVAESLTATLVGASWAPGVSFGVLLLVLAFRPSGLFGRF